MNPKGFLTKINRPLEEKLEETRTIIEMFKDDTCVSWSGGKDSTIVAIEANKIKPDIPIVIQDNGVEFPDSYEYIIKIVKKYKFNFIRLKTKNWFKVIRENPEIMLRKQEVAISSTETKVMKVMNCCHTLRLKILKNFLKENNLTYEFVGQRWDDEPLMRFAVILKSGMIDNRFDVKRVLPLAYWSEKQVYEYYKKFKIPINPSYKKGWISISCWVCPSVSKLGLKKTYPKLYKKRLKLEKKYPWFYKNKPIGYDSFREERLTHHYIMDVNSNLQKIITVKKGTNVGKQIIDMVRGLE